ncbi:MAG: hypothetical protein KJZ58_14435, partial [Flavobacteriales bacterium]|nr:hypothetical protein [Flavobacteriales bacterium]
RSAALPLCRSAALPLCRSKTEVRILLPPLVLIATEGKGCSLKIRSAFENFPVRSNHFSSCYTPQVRATRLSVARSLVTLTRAR